MIGASEEREQVYLQSSSIVISNFHSTIHYIHYSAIAHWWVLPISNSGLKVYLQ